VRERERAEEREREREREKERRGDRACGKVTEICEKLSQVYKIYKLPKDDNRSNRYGTGIDKRRNSH